VKSHEKSHTLHSMSGSGEKRRKQVKIGGPAPKIMPAPGFYARCAAHHAARVAERAVNRYNSVDDGDEIDLLKEQLENIDESEDDGTSNESDLSNERDIIQRRFSGECMLICMRWHAHNYALTRHVR
jgi:hypothetical protein